MAIISKKSATIIVLVLVFGAGSGALGYAIGHNQTKEPAPIVMPKTEEGAKVLERTRKLPENTISPTTVTADIQKYIDKELEVHGIVGQSSADNYILVGQEPKNPGALILDFSQTNLQGSSYASSPPTAAGGTPAVVKGPVTITGTLKQTDKGIVFVVGSVKE